MTDPVAVEIRAELRQIKTMADHTFNVVLNLPESCLPQVQILMGWLLDEVQAVIVSSPDKQEKTESGKVSTRTVRKSSRATA